MHLDSIGTRILGNIGHFLFWWTENFQWILGLIDPSLGIDLGKACFDSVNWFKLYSEHVILSWSLQACKCFTWWIHSNIWHRFSQRSHSFMYQLASIPSVFFFKGKQRVWKASLDILTWRSSIKSFVLVSRWDSSGEWIFKGISVLVGHDHRIPDRTLPRIQKSQQNTDSCSAFLVSDGYSEGNLSVRWRVKNRILAAFH